VSFKSNARPTVSCVLALSAVFCTALVASSGPVQADDSAKFFESVLAQSPVAKSADFSKTPRNNLGADLSARGENPTASDSITGGSGIRWVAAAGCLDNALKAVLAEVAAQYGEVVVNSTCRSQGHNAGVGGAPHSYHLSGSAVDFRVHGNVAGAAAFLNSRVGGYRHYGGGLFHVDTGPRRPM
jgi:Peptidase M15